MCGIVGYVGSQQAAPILLDGLSKLEYRGYDSAGLAVRNGTEETEVIKAKGRLKVLFEKTNVQPFREPVESVTPDGQHTGNRQRTMRIRI